MTAVSYPDCRHISPHGRFLLEARSPHNGTIHHQDGRPASPEEPEFKYREFQTEFRYQLLDTATQTVLWERWQTKNEGSPHQVVVSDEGWSILRTHGFKSEVIAVSPSGQDILKILVNMPGANLDSRPQSHGPPLYYWTAIKAASSTAGMFWADTSWPYFFHHNREPYFIWRTWWGQRLVLNLKNATSLSDSEQAEPSLAQAIVCEEQRLATELLAELAAQIGDVKATLAAINDSPEPPLIAKIRLLRVAADIAGTLHIENCIPFLKALEPLNLRSYSTHSSAMGRNGTMEVQYFRPIIQHSLRILGQPPAGYAAYHFKYVGSDHVPAPECLPNRNDLFVQIHPHMNAEAVLKLIGAPDFLRRYSTKVDRFYRWTEHWCYDFKIANDWQTLQLIWEEYDNRVNLTKIERSASIWMNTETRREDILRI